MSTILLLRSSFGTHISDGHMYRLSYERRGDISFIARETISYFVTSERSERGIFYCYLSIGSALVSIHQTDMMSFYFT